jgi:hypothetical protein
MLWLSGWLWNTGGRWKSNAGVAAEFWLAAWLGAVGAGAAPANDEDRGLVAWFSITGDWWMRSAGAGPELELALAVWLRTACAGAPLDKEPDWELDWALEAWFWITGVWPALAME